MNTNFYILIVLVGLYRFVYGFISPTPIINIMQDKIPIENKINLMYLSYSGRQVFHTIGISQDFVIHKLQNFVQDFEWTELDYFNTVVLMSALYALIKNIKVKKTIDKLTENGIINKRRARKKRIVLFTIFTILFRDVENAI